MAGWGRRRTTLLGGLLVAVVAVVVAISVSDDPAVETTRAPTTTSPTTTSPTTTSQDATTVPDRTTTSVAPTTTAPPPFRSSVEPVTAEQLGSSYTPGLGCAEPASLRALELSHWGYDGEVHDGRIIVAASEAENVVAVFADIYAARFPIERMVPVDQYGADDQASMRANNTSGYNCRTVAGTATLSNHAFGKAIDVNPLHNPYVKGGSIDPPEGAPWADRSDRRPGMIFADDAVVAAFAARGWSWGGDWNSPDFQHFDT